MFALVAAATAHPAWTASTAARKLAPAGSDFDAPPVLAPKAVPRLPRTPKPWAMAYDNQTNAVKQKLFVLPSSEARDPWKRKIFLVLGQSNANGRGNAGRLTEDDRKRLANVADRVILTYRGSIAWPVRGSSAPGETGHWSAFGTRARRVPLGPLPMDLNEQENFGFTTSFGPELFMGISLAEAMPGELLHIVKLATPGVSLYGQWNPMFTSDKCCQSCANQGNTCDGRPDMEWRPDGVPESEESLCDTSPTCGTTMPNEDRRLCELCCASYKPINDEYLGSSCSTSDAMRVAMYPTLVADARELVKRGGELAGWIWVGGERDLSSGCGREYQAHLEQFVRSLRQDLKARLPGALFCPVVQHQSQSPICVAHRNVTSALPDLDHYDGVPLHTYLDEPFGQDAQRVAHDQKQHYDYVGQKKLGESASRMLLGMM